MATSTQRPPSRTTATRQDRPAPREVDIVADEETGEERRFRQRRIEVQREEGRRRLRVIGALTLVTLLVIGGIAASNSALLDVDRLDVVGTAHTPSDAIASASGIAVGSPILSADLDGASRGIEELPWVQSVAVSRDLPGVIVIEVVEREPVIAVNAASGFMLVDRQGRQLELVQARPADFVPVAGVQSNGVAGEPAPVELQSVLLLLDAMSESLTSQTSQILVDQGILYVELVDGGRIKLGDDAGLAEKIVSAETVLAHVDLRCLWEIDVRVPTAPAVTRLRNDGESGISLTDLQNCS